MLGQSKPLEGSTFGLCKAERIYRKSQIEALFSKGKRFRLSHGCFLLKIYVLAVDETAAADGFGGDSGGLNRAVAGGDGCGELEPSLGGGKSVATAENSSKETHQSGEPIFKALFSAPKSSFKRTVDRNRIKRLLKEAFRLNKASFAKPQNPQKHILFAFVFVRNSNSSIKKLKLEDINSLFARAQKPINTYIENAV